MSNAPTDIQPHIAENSAALRRVFNAAFGETALVLNEIDDLNAATMPRIWARHAAMLADIVEAVPPQTLATFGKTPACAAGCTMCCFQHVIVTSTEAFRIAAHLDPAIDRAHLEQQARQVRGLTHEQRYARAIPCAFLKAKKCSIYAERPQTCRTYFSLSRSACQRDWDRRRRPAKPHWPHIPVIAEPQTYGCFVEMGVDFALHRASEGRLQLVRGELANMVAVALQPGALDAWLTGARVFPADMFRPQTIDIPGTYIESLEGAARQFDTEEPQQTGESK